MERIWRLGAAGFGVAENEGPCRGSRCLLLGVEQTSILGGCMSACSHKRTLALPEAVEHWSLTTLREKLIKIGAKVVSHGHYATLTRLL